MITQGKYLKSFSLGFQSSLEYRANFIISFLSTLFPITIQYFLWTALYNNSPNGKVYGYNYSQIIAYTIFAAIVSKFVSGGFEWEVNEDIKNGGLNKFLIKPIDYYKYRIACFLGQKVSQFFIMAIILILTIAILNITLGYSVNLARIFIFFIVIIISIQLSFIFVYCTSMAAFWLSEAGGIFVIGSLLLNIISGGVVPLEVFGNTINHIFNFLPFKYIIYFPINILNGVIVGRQIIYGVLLQIFWIIVCKKFADMLWKQGLKRHNAVGG
jgi:ABC-2 type transport system permease protein